MSGQLMLCNKTWGRAMISAVHVHGQEAGGDTHGSYSPGFSNQTDGDNQYL